MLHRRTPILLPALQNGNSVVREFLCWGWERTGARLAAQRAFACFGRQTEGRKTGTQWVQPPKAVSALQFRQTTSGAHISAGRADGLLRGKSLQAAGIGICRSIGFQPASVSEGFQKASGKPFGAPAGAYLLPRVGMTRRLRRGWWGCRPMGFMPASVPEGFQRANGKPFGVPAGAYLLPRVGMDAPTTARVVGLPPYGAFTLYLSVAKEKCAKESQRHGDSEGGPRRYAPWASACGSPFGAVLALGSLRSPAGKSPLLPIFERGSSQCRAQSS